MATLMLIINGDDLGRDRAATDACLHCHRQKRITSASIMVFMADSERAAELAIDDQLETGLHVNLVLPFDGPGVPEGLRKTQNSTTAFFRRGPWTQAVFNPFIARAVAEVFFSQLEEYRRLFRREPGHFNGHKHFHLSLNMMAADVLPPGSVVRRNFTYFRGEKNWLNRRYRKLIDAWLLRKHISTDAFFSLDPLSDRPRFLRIAELAETKWVELMVHPWSPGHLAFLTGEEFGLLTERARLAGFTALRSSLREKASQ
jgi:predicted glycoside hydrolase/deacetylase ChbG (UPF0249 family)